MLPVIRAATPNSCAAVGLAYRSTFFGLRCADRLLCFPQLPNVSDQLGDLWLGQLVLIGRHLAFALGFDLGQRGIGFLLNLGRTKAPGACALASGGVTLSVSTMAHNALGFIKAGGILSFGADTKDDRHQNRK